MLPLGPPRPLVMFVVVLNIEPICTPALPQRMVTPRRVRHQPDLSRLKYRLRFD